MCRLAAFPPMFPRIDAIEILLEFEGHNTDGTGSVFLRDGQFVVNKWARSLQYVLKTKSFLANMPHPGWTIAHLRAASHGANTKENTHPFIVGPWAVVHNGVWNDYNIAKLALNKYVKFTGETDSEVAAHLINVAGPKKFAEEINFGGVFLGLNKDGSLWVMKTSGELVLFPMMDEKVLIASELDDDTYENTYEALLGWYHFDKEGKYMKHKETKSSFMTRFPWQEKDENIPKYAVSTTKPIHYQSYPTYYPYGGGEHAGHYVE